MKQESSTSKAAKAKPWAPAVFRVEPLPPPLPLLSIPYDPDEEVVNVQVLACPTVREAKSLTWVVDERPKSQIGRGHLVTLSVGNKRSGVGRLTAACDLRRHWVTWMVAGGPGQCSLRVPIPWAALTGVEGVAHAKYYLSLPAIPIPHPAFLNPLIIDARESPYEFGQQEEEEKRLEARLEEIICRRWQKKPKQVESRQASEDVSRE